MTYMLPLVLLFNILARTSMWKIVHKSFNSVKPFVIIVILCLLSSCGTTKKLAQSDEYLQMGSSVMDRNVIHSSISKIKGNEAITYFQKAVAKNDSNVSAYYKMGKTYHYMGEYVKAIEAFSKGLEIAADYFLLYLHRGHSYARIADGQAEEDYLKYLRHHREDPTVYFALGTHLMYDTARQHESIQYLDTAIVLDGSYADAFYNRAFVKMLDGQYLSALNDANFSIELLPDDKGAYINRGLIKSYLDLHQGAIEDYAKALNCETTSANKIFNQFSYNNTGNSYMALNNYEKACEYWQRAIDSGYEFDSEWESLFKIEDPVDLIARYCK